MKVVLFPVDECGTLEDAIMCGLCCSRNKARSLLSEVTLSRRTSIGRTTVIYPKDDIYLGGIGCIQIRAV